MMRESIDQIAMIRRNLASIADNRLLSADNRIATGHGALDDALDGGLARGRVHELFAAEAGDGPSAAGFTAMLALRAVGDRAPIFWLRTDEAARCGGQIFGPGLAELGGDPGSLVLGQAPDTKALLRSAADAARCPGLRALIVEAHGKCPELDLTASRRLSLAAEQSGATLFLLRLEAEPMPSAADTRWAVSAAPSQDVGFQAQSGELGRADMEANAPGLPMFEIDLLRRRSGPSGMRWRLEWDRDRISFREPTLPGVMVPLPSRRPVSAPAELRLSA